MRKVNNGTYVLIKQRKQTTGLFFVILGELQELRNKVCGSYYLANVLWIVLSFMFQLTFFDTSIDVSIFEQVSQIKLVSV